MSSAGVTKNAIQKNLLVFDVIILLEMPFYVIYGTCLGNNSGRCIPFVRNFKEIKFRTFFQQTGEHIRQIDQIPQNNWGCETI